MRNAPTIFSFFAGAGFLDLGFESAGYSVAYVNEIHRPFLTTYKHARAMLKLPEPKYGYCEGDIASFLTGNGADQLKDMMENAGRQSELVGFIGGPPCPDFSVGGKNRGHMGDQGKLTETYADIICLNQPAFFLFENVKGLWKTHKHREFYESVKRKLIAAGYILTERLINALEFGVPQHRERIILVGFHGSLLHDMGYRFTSSTIPDGAFPWEKFVTHPLTEVLTAPWPTTDPFIPSSCLPCPPGIPRALTVEHWFLRNNVASHPNAKQHFQPRAGLTKFQAIFEGDDSKKSYKRLHRWRYAPTAAYGNNEVHLHPYKARRISVAEALAIQSLPAGYMVPLDLTLTDAFKTVGNGVPFLASQAIARTILAFLEVSQCNDSLLKTSSRRSGNYDGTELINM